MTEPDEALLAAIFGPPLPLAPEAEDRLRQFDAWLAAADVGALESIDAPLFPSSCARLHAGPFSRAVERFWPGLDGDLVWKADMCRQSSAKLGDEEWRALGALQQQAPDIFAIVMARKLVTGQDHGPFGNDWGE